MTSPLHEIHHTYDEYLALEASSNVKHEFLGGQIYAMAGDKFEHYKTLPALRPHRSGSDHSPAENDMVAVSAANLLNLPYHHALMERSSPYPILFTGAGALAILAAIIVRTPAFAAHPDILAWAFTCDLTISLPLLWWLVAVRPGRAGAVTLIPLFVIGVAIAARIMPPAQHTFVDQLRFIAAPLDFITILLVVRRVARIRRIDGSGDPAERIERACAELFGSGAVARGAAFEIATIYYAISGWRKRAPRGFTVHERSSWGTIACVFVFLIAIESVCAHLVVQLWSVKAAWIITALDLYGILWLIGDYHALRLRPTRIDGDTLILSYGLRWRASIALSSIAAIETVHGEAEWKRRGVLKVAILDEPRLLIRFTTPQSAHGLAGLTRTIEAVAILADDDSGFAGAMRAACPHATS